MKFTKKDILNLGKMKMKFGASSSIATVVDYVLYQILVRFLFGPAVSNVISASVGMIINFFLQKRFIFQLRRDARMAFVISVLVSVLGIFISTQIITYLTSHQYFNGNQYVIKAVATGIVFFYNFYMKRFAFERKML